MCNLKVVGLIVNLSSGSEACVLPTTKKLWTPRNYLKKKTGDKSESENTKDQELY